MNTNGKRIATLLVTLGFLLSVFAVFAPVGATGGRAQNFVVNVTFTNADGSHANSSIWKETDTVNITANVSIAAMMENVTNLMLELTIDGGQIDTPYSWGALNVSEFAQHTWSVPSPGYGDYMIMVTAVNGTDNANQTVKTVFYKSLASDISLDTVSLSATEALIGKDEVSITAKLNNMGNLAGDASVSFMLDGTVDLGSVVVNVPAGDTANAVCATKFMNMTITDGVHNITAKLGAASVVSGNLNLSNPKTSVTVDALAVNPTSGFEGAIVNFTVTLSNSGNIDATGVLVYFHKMMGAFQPVMLGNLSNLTVLKGATGVNFTWAYTLPNATGAQEIQTIRAGYFDGTAIKNYQTADVTILKKSPVITFVSFVIPAGIRQYDDVVMNVTIKNTGTADAVNMTMKINQGGMTFCTTAPFNLVIGAQKTVPMEVKILDDGGVNQSFMAVASAGGQEFSNTTTVFVDNAIFAEIGITSFKISPNKKENQPKDSSQSFTAEIVLKNIGKKAGKVQLILVEKLKLVANQSFDVGSLETKTVKVKFSVKGDGSHTIIAGVSGDFDIANMTKTAKCELKYQPGFEVVALVAAVLVAVVLIRRRKN